MYIKEPHEPKHRLSINMHQQTGTGTFKNHKAFIEYSSDMRNIYQKFDDYNLHGNYKPLILFGGIITDKLSNWIIDSGREQIISIAFITESNFAVLKNCYIKLYNFFLL